MILLYKLVIMELDALPTQSWYHGSPQTECDAGNFFLRVQPIIYKSTIPLVLNACLMLRVIVFLLHDSFPAKYTAEIGRNKAMKAKLIFFSRETSCYDCYVALTTGHLGPRENG